MSEAAVDTAGPSLRAVLDAVGSIAADLDLGETLQRIVDAAAELSGARYGALGVLDDSNGPDDSNGLDDSNAHRRLREFVTHGVSAEQRALIGDPPTGHGILGVLIDNPEPVRIADLGRHQLSIGFPANHPPMKTFLGAPIRIGPRIFGNLYLTERAGGGPFTEQDAELVVALAAAAGVVIENARLYGELNRQRGWLQAAAAVSTRLLGGSAPEHPPAVIAEHARAAADAAGAVLLLPAAGRPGLWVAGSAGATIDGTPIGRTPAGFTPAGTRATDTTASGTRATDTPPTDRPGPDTTPTDTAPTDTAASEQRWQAAEAVLHTGVPVSPLPGGDLMVRVGATERVAGVLWLHWSPGSLDRVHESVVASAEGFAEQVALVLEVALAQDDRARLAVFEDRDRIGRDLHDLVIQRLFAVGLTLENTSRLAGDGRVADRISTTVDQLDETIKDIRRTIFELANPERAADLRDELDAVVVDMQPSIGFSPHIRTSGPVHSGVSDHIRPHLLAVLREGLSNVGRHAHARSATVSLDIGDEISLVIADDGRGLTSSSTGNGLPNMTARAESLGGLCTIGPGPGGVGTKLTWRVPAG